MNVNISKPEQRLVNALRNHLPIEQQLSLGSYSYDIFYKNKIIEFNGDYWHANPELYFFEDYVGNIIDNKPTYAYEIWAKDAKKLSFAKDNGYEVLVIWEAEFRELPKSTVEKCLRFLRG